MRRVYRGYPPGMSAIDLRSDTVTLPVPEMRKAMAAAPVGDDVYGEDPTVRRLEATAAERLQMGAALFVPSGTMANQAALQAQTRPGDLVLAARDAHVLTVEGGGAAALSGLQIDTTGSDGAFDADDLAAALPPDDPHYPPVTLIALENTHNAAGGRILPLDPLPALRALARERGIAMHLDGARLFNAAVAAGVPVSAWATHFDTVSFCLSKGLGAPVGSLVCCSAALRPTLDRVRKRLGGAMRQSGILAAAGLYALEHHVDRLTEDHVAAARLAEGLAELGARVEGTPQTNIVMFHVDGPLAFWRAARASEVLFNPPQGTRFRAVTHLGAGAEEVEDALHRLRPALQDAARDR